MSNRTKKENKNFELPTVSKIDIDTSVSLLMTSTPPGNPGISASPSVRKERHIPFQNDRWNNPFDLE